MLFEWTKAPLLALVCGLCLSAHAGANAQDAAEVFSVNVPQSVATRPLGDLPGTQPAVQPEAGAATTGSLPQVPPQQAQEPGPSAPLAELPSTTPVAGTKRIALLLPLRSATLGPAADAVRAGFFAAYERERQGIEVTLVATGDAPQDVLAGYRNASASHDIVVGPLTRSGVTMLARSGEVMRPTIALTSPDYADGTNVRPPPLMLAMGLSIEDEARQVAEWAQRDHATAVAYVVYTPTAWQSRAARAFAEHWRRSGMAAEMVELELVDGFLSPNSLRDLRARLEAEPNAFMFAALDAGLARQLRESVGRQYPLYGTSQLNPVALVDRAASAPIEVMEGANLLDIPWQLQPDNPAVMAYPKRIVPADQRRNADLERLYALGIDAYRVARRLAAEDTNFELDGVTGRLQVRFDRLGPYFARTTQQAVYRDGSVTPMSALR